MREANCPSARASAAVTGERGKDQSSRLEVTATSGPQPWTLAFRFAGIPRLFRRSTFPIILSIRGGSSGAGGSALRGRDA